MKRSAINTTLALALGLGLTLALLWLFGGSPAVTHARGPDGLAIASEMNPSSLSPDVPVAGRVGHEPLDRPDPDEATRERVGQALFNLPLRFIANAGQTDPAVHFVVKGAGHTIFFTEEEVVFSAVSSEFQVPSDELRPRPELTSNSELITHNSELFGRAAAFRRSESPACD